MFSLPSLQAILPKACLPVCMVLLGALGTLGCVDPEPGGGVLYVFDQGSTSVLAFKDLKALHDAARDGKPLPEVDRRITSRLLDGLTLAWGGLALDDTHHRLYLVAESGKVVVITHPGDRKGELAAGAEVTSFTLGRTPEAGRSRPVFGQASVDPAEDILYVLENKGDGEAARLWRIAQASKVAHGAVLERREHALQGLKEKRGLGVAAAQGHTFYGLFGAGPAFRDPAGQDLTGPRLREGKGTSFPANAQNTPAHTLIGSATGLATGLPYGSLAFDARLHTVYALVPPAPDDEASRASILVFGAGQFHGHHDQAPQRSLPEVPRDLRILAQSPPTEWLLGAAFTPAEEGRPGQGRGTKALYLWKDPGENEPPLKLPSLPGATEIRGMAVGAP